MFAESDQKTFKTTLGRRGRGRGRERESKESKKKKPSEMKNLHLNGERESSD